METTTQRSTEVDVPANELDQNRTDRQELKEADAEAGQKQTSELTEEQLEQWAQEEIDTPAKQWGDSDGDRQILRADERAAPDADARLQPTNWKRAAQRLASILPAGISLKNIKELANRFALSGREVGAAVAPWPVAAGTMPCSGPALDRQKTELKRSAQHLITVPVCPG